MRSHARKLLITIFIFGLLGLLAACQSTQTPSAPPPSPTASPTATITSTPSPSPTPTRTPMMVAPSYNGFTPPGALATLGKGSVNCFTLSPDDEYLAVGGPGGVYFYDAETLAEIWRDPHPACSLDFSPDSFMLAIGTDASVIVLNTTNGNELFTLREDFVDEVETVAFSPDGSTLAIGDYQGELISIVSISDINRNHHILTSFEYPESASDISIQYSPDGTRLFIEGRFRISALDLTSLSPDNTLEDIYINDKWDYCCGEGALVKIASFDISPDGKSLAVGWINGITTLPFTLINIDAKEIWGESNCYELGMSGGAYHAFSPDGHLIADRADSGYSGTIFISDAHTFETIYTIPVGELSEIALHRFVEKGLAFSANGDTLIALQNYSFIAFLDTETGESLRILTDHNSWCGEMAFSPDSSQLATSYFAQGIIVWDVESGEPAEPPLWTDHYSIRGLYYAEDGSLYAKGKNRDDVLDKANLWEFKEGEFIPSSFSMIPVAYPVAECNDEGQIIINYPSAEVTQRVLRGPKCTWSPTLAVSPDTTHIAVAEKDQVRYWDLVSEQQEQIYTYQQGWDIDRIALSNELLTVSGKEDRKSEAVTVIWDLTTGEIVEVLKGQRESILDMAFSPDGTILATRSFDGTIVLWPIGDQ